MNPTRNEVSLEWTWLCLFKQNGRQPAEFNVFGFDSLQQVASF